jgi:hypothetical protein
VERRPWRRRVRGARAAVVDTPRLRRFCLPPRPVEPSGAAARASGRLRCRAPAHRASQRPHGGLRPRNLQRIGITLEPRENPLRFLVGLPLGALLRGLRPRLTKMSAPMARATFSGAVTPGRSPRQTGSLRSTTPHAVASPSSPRPAIPQRRHEPSHRLGVGERVEPTRGRSAQAPMTPDDADQGTSIHGVPCPSPGNPTAEHPPRHIPPTLAKRAASDRPHLFSDVRSGELRVPTAHPTIKSDSLPTLPQQMECAWHSRRP